MHARFSGRLIICATLLLSLNSFVFAQGGSSQSDLSPLQRMDVMRSKLESMRRSLNSAVSGLESQGSQSDKKNPDDPRQRLRGLDKEVGSLLSEVNDLRSKQERAERYDQTALDRLESSVVDLDKRVQAGLQSTASVRTTASNSGSSKGKKKKGKFFGLFGGGGDNKYEELTGTVAAGRDRVLFEEAAKEVRKGNH